MIAVETDIGSEVASLLRGTGGAAVTGALAGAAGAGVHLLVLLALELFVENAGCGKTRLAQDRKQEPGTRATY